MKIGECSKKLYMMVLSDRGAMCEMNRLRGGCKSLGELRRALAEDAAGVLVGWFENPICYAGLDLIVAEDPFAASFFPIRVLNRVSLFPDVIAQP